jgi:hypothetical protein
MIYVIINLLLNIMNGLPFHLLVQYVTNILEAWAYRKKLWFISLNLAPVNGATDVIVARGPWTLCERRDDVPPGISLRYGSGYCKFYFCEQKCTQVFM